MREKSIRGRKWLVIVVKRSTATFFPDNYNWYGTFGSEDTAYTWGNDNAQQFEGDWWVVPVYPAWNGKTKGLQGRAMSEGGG
jgi:hypothetical protein